MKQFDIDRYASLAMRAAQEGIVLLRNEQNALPLQSGLRISVFGRNQLNYYKSGTGSGGMVNAPYVKSIMDALKNSQDLIVNQQLADIYAEWEKENPFEKGSGWGKEPWSQKEMPLSREIVEQAAAQSDVALVLVGRTAGEDRDNYLGIGSMYLTAEEEQMLELVCGRFKRTIILLNTGNIIDMSWVEAYKPSAVLYVWQGGQEGGQAVVNVLTGVENPSGKLTDTVPWKISDDPSMRNFGDKKRNFYEEDIYVGYRYYETFAKEQVQYPFGFGLSYTNFEINTTFNRTDENTFRFDIAVKNTGKVCGKETVQMYCQAPQGLLGKPARILCGYAKTKCLQPGQQQVLTILLDRATLASYDDTGKTGYISSYVLEAGKYVFYVGTDVRTAESVGDYMLDETVQLQQLQQVLAPIEPFQRLCPVDGGDGSLIPGYESVPLRQYTMTDRMEKERPEEVSYTGDCGWKLKDVYDGKVDMDTFIRQICPEDLCIMVRGEGMCSPKVTPGTAAAFGGITPRLQEYGIPAACCADGPSGIRMDCGTMAFSLPNGTCLASSFNDELVQELFESMGMELRKNQVDILLGPGLNIHRNLLNGRNFEYFSEDPFLTGKMTAAQIRGMQKYQVTGAIKHFACNNQEIGRRTSDSVVSERALREIYLKGFEIAVKEGHAQCVMSAYNALNGLWTASNYDLLTVVLREEWGFDGMVMTDWHSMGNEEGCEPSTTEVAPVIRAQNDLYMVVTDAANNSGKDNLAAALNDGRLRYAELCRSAGNICKLIMNMPTFRRFVGIPEDIQFPPELQQDFTMETVQKFVADKNGELAFNTLSTAQGISHMLHVFAGRTGHCHLKMELRVASENALAQIPMTISKNGETLKTISLWGSDTTWQEYDIDLKQLIAESFYLKFFFGQSGIQIGRCQLEFM